MMFADWFHDHYRREGEAKFRAIHRLAGETGLAWTTVHRALQGTRVTGGSAAVLSEASDGHVAVESLTSAPTRREVEEQDGSTGTPPEAA